MDLFSFFLCWTPVLLLACLAVIFQRSALELAFYGAGFTALLACLFFHTPLSVIGLAAMDGVLTTLPLLLVLWAGILLSNLLVTSGSLSRVVTWLMGGFRQILHRHLLIIFGMANFLEGASVIAEPVIAPMLQVIGVNPRGAAALSIVGYAGLMTVEMAGIIVTVMALVTGLPLQDLGVASAWLSVPATLAMAVCVPLFLSEENLVWRGLPTLLAGALGVSLVAVAVATLVAIPLAGMGGGLALILVLLLIYRPALSNIRIIIRDLIPFAAIIIPLLLVNIVPWLKDRTCHHWVFSFSLIPIHTITFTPFYSAYLYLFMALALAVVLLKLSPQQVKELWMNGMGRSWRALIAMGLFGAMGQMITYTGYTDGFAQLSLVDNMPWLLAEGLKTCTGSFYPVFVPLLGWVGTFLTGYGVASLLLFGKLQVQAAELLGISATWLAAGLAVGASIGSISSPFKIAIATPMVGAMGQEGWILRLTIPLGVAASLFIGLILWALL
jgi:lactate permease